jgi:thymidylate kinase
MMKRGLLYVFEGPDGVGKTTLSKWFAKYLEAEGTNISWSSFPGRKKGTLGDVVYKLHHAPSKFGVKSVEPLSLQMLHVAAHIEAIQSTFIRQLEAGTTIVLDRYWWSTWVYGCHGGADRSVLNTMIRMEKRIWGSIRPHRLILISRKSSMQDVALDRLYRYLARRESKSQHVVRATNDGSLSSTKESILSSIK